MEKLSIEFLLDLNPKSRSTISVSPKDTVRAAAKVLAAHNIGLVLVVAGDALVGVLSERDIVQRWVCGNQFPVDVAVEEVMTRDVECVGAQDTIYDCYLRFQARKCRHLPVLDPMKRVIGVLSIRDVTSYVVNRLSERPA